MESWLPYDEPSSSQHLQLLLRQFAIPLACQIVFIYPYNLTCSRFAQKRRGVPSLGDFQVEAGAAIRCTCFAFWAHFTRSQSYTT